MDIRLLAETMKEMSDTAGDHHWLAGVALEGQQKHIERLEDVMDELVEAGRVLIECFMESYKPISVPDNSSLLEIEEEFHYIE